MNVAQAYKYGPVFYQQTHAPRDKEAFMAGVRNLMPYHTQITGMNSCTEFLSGMSSIQGVELCSTAERTALDEIKRWGFTDTFRQHHEEGGQFSWWDYRAGAFRRNLGLRIDHMWVTKPLVTRSLNTWIDIEPRTWERPSDHAPVVAEFE